MQPSIRVGIIGDFTPEFESHHATNAALVHAAGKLSMRLDLRWLPTPALAGSSIVEELECCDGLWASPGSPYRSMRGALAAIEFARKHDWPFLGTCGGFQHAVLEFARNVLGIADADSAEHGSGSGHIFITPVACPSPERAVGAPKLSGGANRLVILPGTHLARIYGCSETLEHFFCNYEVNPAYRTRLEDAGVRVSAQGPGGETRAMELPDKRFFVATLFQPQLAPLSERPHPLIAAYLDAVAAFAKVRAERPFTAAAQ